jgi:hypothetical protein
MVLGEHRKLVVPHATVGNSGMDEENGIALTRYVVGELGARSLHELSGVAHPLRPAVRVSTVAGYRELQAV